MSLNLENPWFCDGCKEIEVKDKDFVCSVFEQSLRIIKTSSFEASFARPQCCINEEQSRPVESYK